MERVIQEIEKYKQNPTLYFQQVTHAVGLKDNANTKNLPFDIRASIAGLEVYIQEGVYIHEGEHINEGEPWMLRANEPLQVTCQGRLVLLGVRLLSFLPDDQENRASLDLFVGGEWIEKIHLSKKRPTPLLRGSVVPLASMAFWCFHIISCSDISVIPIYAVTDIKTMYSIHQQSWRTHDDSFFLVNGSFYASTMLSAHDKKQYVLKTQVLPLL